MKTKSFILVAVAVFAALLGGFMYVALSGGGDERRAGALAAQSYATGNYLLEIGGKNVGALKSVSGCGVTAELVGAVGSSKIQTKQAANVRYGPCEITFGHSMDSPFFAWINDTLKGNAGPKNVAIVAVDANQKATTRLELTGAVIRSFALPKLEAGSKDPVEFTVTIDPQTIQKSAGGGAAVPSISPKAKSLLASNYRLDAPGLTSDLKKVPSVESWSFEVSQPAGTQGVARQLGGNLVLGNLSLAVSEPGSEFDAWLDSLTKGNPSEKNVTLELLDPTLKDALMSVSFSGVGLLSGQLLPAADTGSKAVGSREFTMYVQGASINFNASPAA
jgi:phage tail-like protein